MYSSQLYANGEWHDLRLNFDIEKDQSSVKLTLGFSSQSGQSIDISNIGIYDGYNNNIPYIVNPIEASEMINSQSASFQEEIQKIKDIRNSISIEEINELSNINRNSLIKSEAERIKTRLLALEEEVSKADITVRNKYREMIDDYTVYITDQYLN